MKKQKDLRRTTSFDRILELCHRRVRRVAEHGGLNTVYEIPGMIVGFPLYNVHECTHYLVDVLRKDGFLVQILPPPHIAVVYVSWDPAELKPILTKTTRKGLPASAQASQAALPPPSLPHKTLTFPGLMPPTHYALPY